MYQPNINHASNGIIDNKIKPLSIKSHIYVYTQKSIEGHRHRQLCSAATSKKISFLPPPKLQNPPSQPEAKPTAQALFHSPAHSRLSGLQKWVGTVHAATIPLLTSPLQALASISSPLPPASGPQRPMSHLGGGLKTVATQTLIFYCHITSSACEIFTVRTE